MDFHGITIEHPETLSLRMIFLKIWVNYQKGGARGPAGYGPISTKVLGKARTVAQL